MTLLSGKLNLLAGLLDPEVRLTPLSFLHTSLSLLSAESKTLSLRVRTGIREFEEREVRLSSPNSYWVARLEMCRHSDSTTSGCIRLLEEVRRSKDPSSVSMIPRQPFFFFLLFLMLISISSSVV